MPTLDELPKLIDELNPGAYRFSPAMRGRATGIRVERDGVPGYAFIYEPSGDKAILVALHDFGDENAEVWSTASLPDLEKYLRRWGFPQRWTAPKPVDRTAAKRQLQKIVDGLRERPSTVGVSVSDDARVAGAGLDEQRLVLNFPWDSAGRLKLDTTVVLAIEDDEPIKATKRTRCLVASGPRKRRDPALISVHFEDVYVVNQDHRWDERVWLWTATEVPRVERELSASQKEALNRMDGGGVEEVLEDYGVTLSPDMHRLLGGERIVPPACCAHPDQAWSDMLVGIIRACLPWKLVAAVAAELRDREPKARKRGAKPVLCKLAIFPGQFHARKACLMLGTMDQGQTVQLRFETTASNARLYQEAWKRPLAIELSRYGLVGP